MSGYRNDLEAAQRRIDTLEAQLVEREASLKARSAEIAELENKLRRTPMGRARARGVWAAVAGALLTSLIAGSFLGYRLSTLLLPRSEHAARCGLAEPVAQLPETMERPSEPHGGEVIDPWGSGEGTLVAIAIGGACSFAVDGVTHGTNNSIRIKVDEGPHVVTCTAAGQTRSQRVNVGSGRPGIASFKL